MGHPVLVLCFKDEGKVGWRIGERRSGGQHQHHWGKDSYSRVRMEACSHVVENGLLNGRGVGFTQEQSTSWNLMP